MEREKWFRYIVNWTIESIAISGSNIYGISSNKKLYEWSTANLNSVSNNSEAKFLIRQDFPMKEYQLKNAFNSLAKLQNQTMYKD